MEGISSMISGDNAIDDLTWYYQEANGACGVRSGQGGFEAAMQLRAMSGPAAFGGIHLHETRPSPTDDGVDARRLSAWGRARRIHEALHRISRAQQRVLENQYCDCSLLRDVSLSLVASLPESVHSHQLAQKSSALARDRDRAREAKRAALGRAVGGAPRVRAKRERPTAQTTARDWVLWLATTDTDGVQLIALCSRARSDLAAALAAYRAAEIGS